MLQAGSQLCAQHLERCLIGSWSSPYHKVGTKYQDEREDLTTHDLPKASLQAIALHDGSPVLGNNDTNPRMTQKGSEDPNLEVLGSRSLPFTEDFLQIRPPGQAKLAGEGSVFRRRRTWSAAGR